MSTLSKKIKMAFDSKADKSKVIKMQSELSSLPHCIKCRLQVINNTLRVICDNGTISSTDSIVLYRYGKHRNGNKNEGSDRIRKKGWYISGTVGKGTDYIITFSLTSIASDGKSAYILPDGYQSFDAYQKMAHGLSQDERIYPFLDKRSAFAIHRDGKRISEFMKFTMFLYNDTWYFCPWHSNQ